MERRLAAILANDVVGYSRLIRADEEGTIAALKALRADIIDPKLAEHHGRIVKLMGDGMLAEFASVVDAVRAAVETQQAVTEHNSGLPEDKRIKFRVGINLGDVVIDGDDIQGDGVNVAARLEGLAKPGGICISGSVHEQVRDRTDFKFEDLGEQEVNNIDRPVRVWRWIADAGLAESISSAPAAAGEPHSSVVGTGNDTDGQPRPARAAIAVLPFDNLSDDPEQEYFADGITEDIITALSHVRTFSVLARNSTFVYKGKSVDAKDIGNVLGVHYLVEGSVRRAGDRVRVSAQLIDATSGDHLWAERYDGTLDDIFDLQDRITSTIVGTIEPELVRAEGLRLHGKPPDNMDAYDYLLRGVAYMHKLTPEDTKKGLACFEKAIELDPKYGRAYAFAAWCYRRDVQQRGLASLSEGDRRKATDLARKALRCDRNDPFVLAYAGRIFAFIGGNFDEALALTDRALSMHPNSHRFWSGKAKFHAFRGDTAEAIAAAEHAIAVSPHEPAIWVAYWSIAEAHLQELRYEEAVDFAKRAIRHNEHVGPAYYILAAASAHLGKEADAQEALAAALKINPGMTVQTFPENYQVAQFKNLDAYLDGLRKAGLPE